MSPCNLALVLACCEYENQQARFCLANSCKKIKNKLLKDLEQYRNDQVKLTEVVDTDSCNAAPVQGAALLLLFFY